MHINKNVFTTDKYYLTKRIDKNGMYCVILGVFFDEEKTKAQCLEYYEYTNRDSAYQRYYKIKKQLENERV